MDNFVRVFMMNLQCNLVCESVESELPLPLQFCFFRPMERPRLYGSARRPTPRSKIGGHNPDTINYSRLNDEATLNIVDKAFASPQTRGLRIRSRDGAPGELRRVAGHAARERSASG